MDEKKIPWRDNAFSMMALYSILTAMVGVLLAVIITDKEIADYWYWPVGLLSLSFVCFIWGTEKLSDALDENDVDKHLAWFLAYNTGVIAMFFGIASYVFLHYHLNFSISYAGGNLAVNGIWNLAPYLIALLASSKWIHDNYDLIFDSREEYDKYRKELTSKAEPEKDPDWLVKLHRFIRKLLHG